MKKMNAAAGPTPVALRAPYIGPAEKQDNSELTPPTGLSKQWGPPYLPQKLKYETASAEDCASQGKKNRE